LSCCFLLKALKIQSVFQILSFYSIHSHPQHVVPFLSTSLYTSISLSPECVVFTAAGMHQPSPFDCKSNFYCVAKGSCNPLHSLHKDRNVWLKSPLPVALAIAYRHIHIESVVFSFQIDLHKQHIAHWPDLVFFRSPTFNFKTSNGFEFGHAKIAANFADFYFVLMETQWKFDWKQSLDDKCKDEKQNGMMWNIVLLLDWHVVLFCCQWFHNQKTHVIRQEY